MYNRLLGITAISGFVLVMLGAFASHILQGQLTLIDLNNFAVAERYHLLHTVTLLCIAILYARDESNYLRVSAYAFINGIVLFSGSLYLKSIDRLIPTDLSFLTPIIPLGGLFLLIGWFMLGYYGFLHASVQRFKRRNSKNDDSLLNEP